MEDNGVYGFHQLRWAIVVVW